LNGHEIAKKLGVGKTTVYRHIDAKGHKVKRWTEKELNYVINARAKGRSYEYIAKRLKRNANQVEIKLCRYRKAVLSDPRKREVLRLLAFGIQKGATPEMIIKGIRKSKCLEV
jgi:predicted transcriptional regulator